MTAHRGVINFPLQKKKKEAKQNSGVVGNCFFWAWDISGDLWNTRDRFQRQKLSIIDLQDDRNCWANWSVPCFCRTWINPSALLRLRDGSCVGIIPWTNVNCELIFRSLSLPNVHIHTPSTVCHLRSFSTTVALYQPPKPSCTQRPNSPFHATIWIIATWAHF